MQKTYNRKLCNYRKPGRAFKIRHAMRRMHHAPWRHVLDHVTSTKTKKIEILRKENVTRKHQLYDHLWLPKSAKIFDLARLLTPIMRSHDFADIIK